MPPWEKTGVPGDVALAHFHSSTMSGSALWMMSRTFASIFPRQSPSSLILLSIDAEAEIDPEEDPMETVFFMRSSKPGPLRASFWLAGAEMFAPILAALRGTCRLLLILLLST